ncbi:DNA integrity scanning protein DisA [Luteitalea pratensis]|uniref:Diadenylate cyclase n=1 Tax=Luteitalea pratensis TaxID=1855912 RepID=A0A143PI38_LUTPR|nr:diadenylate cyclase CdaA [Luteitalea pratensis]AMY07439.1 DNA integrity scanning protein DisA [Luteitalea pratensis]
MDALASWISRTPITGWDVLDVLVVALIIYESLKLIRGTRAMQMAFGSALLVGLYFFSIAAPLQTVNWLIRNMIGYVVFAAIVLFQNDIRRALAHFGRTPFVRAFSRAENDDETIEEVVTAAVQLADRRTGALIVIERQIGLRNYIESGIPLDAMVTHDLLVSVFQTSGPLHDGAVIIQENKIAAASCFLPLTVSAMVGTDLGTRHRAAIGLTEENDAVAVVVSEETGRISIATEGQISRGFTAETLRARLTQLVLQRKSARRMRPRP